MLKNDLLEFIEMLESDKKQIDKIDNAISKIFSNQLQNYINDLNAILKDN